MPPGSEGPPDPLLTDSGFSWLQVEFGSVIIGTGSGRFGALNDAIYSNNEETFVTVPSGRGSDVRGIWHNHITRSGSLQQAIDRYPSVFSDNRGDWAGLQALADASGVANPSLWLTGPDGVTREFKLSERAYYESLTEPQMERGEGLSGRERNEPRG